jgi:hypothetical protein
MLGRMSSRESCERDRSCSRKPLLTEPGLAGPGSGCCRQKTLHPGLPSFHQRFDVRLRFYAKSNRPLPKPDSGRIEHLGEELT